MSAAPDPAELAPSRDPAAYGRRPLFTAGFFVWAALCLACLAAGTLIGRFGLPASPAAAPAELAARPAAPPPAAPAPIAAPSPSGAAPSGDVGALGERVARLESASLRTSDAAAEALAAAALSAAAQGAGPFDQDVAAYQRLAPGNADLAALAPLAALGAPSRAGLAAALPDLAVQAALTARAPGKDAGFLARLWAVLGRVVIVRNVDPRAAGVDGVLTRAQRDASAGDLESAVRGLETLPPAVRAPLADWLAAAHRRLEIDRRIEALRAAALAALAPPSSGPASPAASPPS
jgi:hypothetical protein